VQTVVHRLPRERVIGQLVVAGNIFLTSGQFGEDRSQQVIGPETLKRRRHLFAKFPP